MKANNVRIRCTNHENPIIHRGSELDDAIDFYIELRLHSLKTPLGKKVVTFSSLNLFNDLVISTDHRSVYSVFDRLFTEDGRRTLVRIDDAKYGEPPMVRTDIRVMNVKFKQRHIYGYPLYQSNPVSNRGLINVFKPVLNLVNWAVLGVDNYYISYNMIKWLNSPRKTVRPYVFCDNGDII